MPLDYPTASIIGSAVATYIVAIAFGTILAGAGFPLPSGRRIGCIDGLRGYLALSVLIHHFVIWLQVTRLGGSWAPPGINGFNNLGAGSVALFFMITGFVFYPRVLAGLSGTAWAATYVSRLFRIIPLIAFSVAIITGIIALRTGRHPDHTFLLSAATWITSWQEVPLLGYTDSGRLNAYVLWSLWYEWQFYIFILPACALIMDCIRRWLPSCCVPVALFMMAPALRRIPAIGHLPMFLPLFAIGMLAFECGRHEAIRRVFQSRASGLVAITCLLIGLVRAPTPYGYIQFLLYGAFFTIVACGNDLGGILRTKASLLLGECSYGIYLLHGTVLSVLFVDGAPLTRHLATSQVPMLLPLACLAVLCITPVTYLLVELPAIQAGKRMARRLSGRRIRTSDMRVEVTP